MDRLNRKRRGLAVVEMAFLLPILLLTLFGMIEYGGLFWRASQLEAAARTGARTGALSGGTAAAVNAAVNALMSADGLGSTGYTVTLSPADPSTMAAGAAFTVTVAVPYSAITLTNCPLVPVPTTVSRACTMVRESG